MLNEQATASDRNALVSSVIRFARLLLQSLMRGSAPWLAIDHEIMPATIFAASIVMGRALVPVEQAVAAWRQFVEAREGYRSVRKTGRVPASRPRTIVPPSGHALRVRGIYFRLPSRKQPIIAL